MSDLSDLYQEVILDHSRKPRNKGALENASGRAEGSNPLCGDELTLWVAVEDGVVREARFEGHGCAISTASASMMTEAVRGMTIAEARALFERFHSSLLSGPGSEIDVSDLGKLASLTGVREYPMRVKCASLAWHTLNAALDGGGETVTTE
ncbi:MAG: SUF system NifU family Fe-S cluster assembly protein [Deltaproteobacteria bacterium]|nr:SUF system NifU family Fe-S cluster assembly protein [Deltaproteobacteria bacterium]MBW2413953.1 SUF system NifU family Fe-S cluster assembly protein [Deltaproteobacteria bacterium]